MRDSTMPWWLGDTPSAVTTSNGNSGSVGDAVDVNSALDLLAVAREVAGARADVAAERLERGDELVT